jgi:hypothetical protein
MYQQISLTLEDSGNLLGKQVKPSEKSRFN